MIKNGVADPEPACGSGKVVDRDGELSEMCQGVGSLSAP